jgi:hypothetical protein
MDGAQLCCAPSIIHFITPIFGGKGISKMEMELMF